MSGWFSRRRERRPDPTAHGARGGQDTLAASVADQVSLDMASAVLFALQACDPGGTLAAHCARVAALAAELAAVCRVDVAHTDVLLRAARLHEVGRIGLAPLVWKDSSEHEPFDEVRGHAHIGAEIVRKTQGEVAGWLVGQQYTDYRAVERRPESANPRVLLAGILRVADVADVLRPDDGADPAAHADLARTILTSGRGTRFHPRAVDAWLDVACGKSGCSYGERSRADVRNAG